MWKEPHDPTRCDLAPEPVARVPVVGNELPLPVNQPRPRQQLGCTNLTVLARVEECSLELRRLVRAGYTIGRNNGTVCTERSRDLTAVQAAWADLKTSVRELCSQQFWQFFLPMYNLSGVAISTALGSARKVFLGAGTLCYTCMPSMAHHYVCCAQYIGRHVKFPPDRRALQDKIRRLPGFWHHVMHSVTIDLSGFALSSGTTKLEFTFLDPLWGWLQAAELQNPLDLHWKHVESCADPVYGGGVQFGKAFAHACRSVPKGSYPMLISLHWDGTSEHRGLASTPICVGVANCNNCDVSTQFCLGYIPKVPDDSPAFRKTPLSTRVKFYIRQQCIHAILRVLENSAETGVLCNLRNRLGIAVTRLLMPRLYAMNLDQPEAQLFFGMLNRTSCSKCKWRKGYSAFRSCTKQDGSAVKRLYRMVDDDGLHKQAAAEKLRRWGFNPSRRCCLLSVSDKLLINNHVPGAPPEVFPGLDWRDRMHGLTIFIHRVFVQTFDGLSKTILSGPNRLMLDQRLHYVCHRRGFRLPGTRRSYRVQKTCFSEVGMTATDRVCMMFLLSHVLGPNAEMVPDNVRQPLLTVIAYAQLLLIAVRGRRGYTQSQLETIFDKGYKVLFGALQSLLFIDYNKRAAQHQAHPNSCNAPATQKLTNRY